MATERNVVDFKIHNLTEEQFQELKAQGKIDPNAVYCTPDTTKERLDALETKTTSLEENKQDIATAVNYDNITNCLTEIPQDIKLELADGTLTLKAGSKIHLAYGDLETTATTTSDISATQTNAGQYVVMRSSKTALYLANIETCLSGTIANRPTSLERSTGLYFATDENKIYLTGDKGANWYSGADYSLPLGIITVSNGAISSIDQVFNGFGYIGSTVFVLPGVEGLVPDGRNADGTLKNIEFATSMVLTATDTSTSTNVLTLNNSNISRITATNYFYDEQKNIIINKYNNAQMLVALYGFNKTDNGVISEFATKTAFHAVDYSDFETLSDTVETLSDTVEINNDNAVHKTGNETIGGKKEFTDTISSNLSAAKPVIQNDTGGQFWLFDYNLDSDKYKGGFLLRCTKADGTKVDFIGNNEGLLTWKGNNVATMPNYGAGVAFTLNKSTSYTAPKDGVVFILTGRANDQGSSIKIDGTQVASAISNWSNIPYFFPVAKGTVVSTGYDSIGSAIFYPLKGAI